MELDSLPAFAGAITMHISEGIISPQVLISGTILCTIVTAFGIKKMDYHEVPKVAILTASFFVASLIHVPLGPSSVHLVLNGLVGLLLGFSCFPAILIALLLQSIFFQYGGITVLGVNTFNMALPALIVYLLCYPIVCKNTFWANIGAFIAGSVAIFLAGIMMALSLALSGKEFIPIAKTILLAHIPIMIIEGIITFIIVNFIKKVRPEMLFKHPFEKTIDAY